VGLAEKLLGPVLCAVTMGGLTMAEVVRWIDLRDSEDEVSEILTDLGDELALSANAHGRRHSTRRTSRKPARHVRGRVIGWSSLRDVPFRTRDVAQLG
jgi:hypothetical protein